MSTELDNPLQAVVATWLRKVELALQFKDKRFAKDASEGMKFFCGPYEWLYGAEQKRTDRHFRQVFDDMDDGEIPPPKFQMTVNKCAELVQLFGPVMYHRNPIRQVNPREYPLPDADLVAAFGGDPNSQLYFQQLYQQGTIAQAIDKSRSKLLEFYLNYTPTALDLKTEARFAIDEAIIKGMGCLWQEVYRPPGGGSKTVGSFYDSVDNLVIDPDMPTLRAAKWVAKRCVRPVWEVERLYQLEPGSLQGSMESIGRQAETDAHQDGAYNRARGDTNDLITYWEIWSKTGVGGRLKGIDRQIGSAVDIFGDYCYLAVANGCPYPLNVPSKLFSMDAVTGMEEIQRRLRWETPYWADDAWPFVPIYFHSVPGDPWPLSHLSPGMGELKFLNWAFSYIAGKIRISCRDIVAILEEAGPEVQEAIVKAADYEIIKVKGSQNKTIDQIVQFLQHPPFSMDIWKVIEAVSEQFDRRVGLSELMYGMSSRQDRSATESQTKRDQMNVRPEDMANKVEDAMSLAARQEAIAIRWHLTGADVVPIMGPVGSAMWDRFITPSNPAELFFQLEYRVEAGSVRKPNRDRDANNAQQVVQTLLPFYETLVTQVGMPGPFNTAVELWCKANDLKSDGLLVPQMAPPQPQPAPAGNPQGGGK